MKYYSSFLRPKSGQQVVRTINKSSVHLDVDKSHPLEILNSPGALFELQHNLIKQFVNSNVQLLAKTIGGVCTSVTCKKMF